MDKNESRICWYSALLVALLVNVPKLLALRENGIIARYWQFNVFEWTLQFAINLCFCAIFFYLNLKPTSWLAIYRQQKKYFQYFSINALLFFVTFFVGSILQYKLFFHALPKIYFSGYFFRFLLSAVLICILIKVILLIRSSKKKDVENEKLKTAYIATELELLKEQLNPHFLFNSLSSLSGIIIENPILAQKYVRDLSEVFRYTLIGGRNNLVGLGDELAMLQSFAQLIYMRLESAFELNIDVPATYFSEKIPHLSLQPLLENAVKHNAATRAKPLKVNIYIEAGFLVVKNTLSVISNPENSNGLGLSNLSERFKIMLRREIEITQSDAYFIVKLPLKI